MNLKGKLSLSWQKKRRSEVNRNKSDIKVWQVTAANTFLNVSY